MEEKCVLAVRRRDLVLAVLGGAAVGCAGVALMATRAFALDWNPPLCDIFWWLWRIVGTCSGLTP